MHVNPEEARFGPKRTVPLPMATNFLTPPDVAATVANQSKLSQQSWNFWLLAWRLPAPRLGQVRLGTPRAVCPWIQSIPRLFLSPLKVIHFGSNTEHC